MLSQSKLIPAHNNPTPMTTIRTCLVVYTLKDCSGMKNGGKTQKNAIPIMVKLTITQKVTTCHSISLPCNKSKNTKEDNSVEEGHSSKTRPEK